MGGGFAFAALAAVVDAARELRDQGTYGFRERSRVGLAAARDALAGNGGGRVMTDRKSATVAVIDDLEAEQERLEVILDGLDDASW